MNLKRNSIISILLVVVLMFIGCSKAPANTVAEVNGEYINLEEFNEEFNVREKLVKNQFGEDALDNELEGGKTGRELLVAEIIENLVYNKLILSIMADKNLFVEEEEIDKAFEDIANSFGGEELFLDFLGEKDIPVSFVRNDLKFDELRKKLADSFEITDEEVQTYYEENIERFQKIKAAHILVEEEEKAKELLGLIKKGENFEELAVMESVDTGSAVNGGDLGFFGRGVMVPEFEEAAFNLDIEEVSEIIKSDFGYHIIKLLDKQSDINDASEEIKSLLKYQKAETTLREARDEAKVKVYKKIIENNK